MCDVQSDRTREIKVSKLGDPKHIHSFEHTHEHDGHKHTHLHQHSHSNNHHQIIENRLQEHFEISKPVENNKETGLKTGKHRKDNSASEFEIKT